MQQKSSQESVSCCHAHPLMPDIWIHWPLRPSILLFAFWSPEPPLALTMANFLLDLLASFCPTGIYSLFAIQDPNAYLDVTHPGLFGPFCSAPAFDQEQLILATAWVGVYKAESPDPSELVAVVDLCVCSGIWVKVTGLTDLTATKKEVKRVKINSQSTLYLQHKFWPCKSLHHYLLHRSGPGDFWLGLIKCTVRQSSGIYIDNH